MPDEILTELYSHRHPVLSGTLLEAATKTFLCTEISFILFYD
jgi:hypothetical protein